MNKWLLILRTNEGHYSVMAFPSRAEAEDSGARFKKSAPLAIVVNLNQLVEELTGRQ